MQRPRQEYNDVVGFVSYYFETLVIKKCENMCIHEKDQT